MDFDLEMEDVPADPYASRGMDNNVLPAQEDILTLDVEPGEINDFEPPANGPEVANGDNPDIVLVPNKIHLCGLDTLTPDDIKAYISEHVGITAAFKRIEWIDDSSANIIFSDTAAAAAALTAISTMSLTIDDPAQLPVGELLPAKPFSKAAANASDATEAASTLAASTALQVRFAVESDRKQAGAAARSRFYLLHPEYDPEERRRFSRHDQDDRLQYRPSSRRYRSYRSYRDDHDDHDRENDIRNNSFDASLYDDDAPALARRTGFTFSSSAHRGRRRSRSRTQTSQSPSRSRRRNNQGKELFGQEGNNRSRDNVAGKELYPDKLACYASESVEEHDASSRDRDRNHDRHRLSNYNSNSRRRDDNFGRLHNSRSASPLRLSKSSNRACKASDDYDGRLADEQAEAAAAAAARNRDRARSFRDRLTSNRDSKINNASKELFPGDRGVNRTPAMDLLDHASSVTAQSSADRITLASNGNSFSVRGLASANIQQGPGLSIKGTASDASARELFPGTLRDNGNGSRGGRGGGGEGRLCNTGQEVLGGNGSLASRITRPRQRAEDMFH